MDERINSLVIGSEVRPVESEEEATDITEAPVTRERSREGVQMIAHVEDPDDVDDMIAALGDAWEQARRERGLDG